MCENRELLVQPRNTIIREKHKNDQGHFGHLQTADIENASMSFRLSAYGERNAESVKKARCDLCILSG
jgi:hypothetical protein